MTDVEERLRALEQAVAELREEADADAARRRRAAWIRIAVIAALALAYALYFDAALSQL